MDAQQINAANAQLTIFIVPNNEEHTYENIGTIYTALYLSNQNWPIFLLDIEGSSQKLINPSRSVDLEVLKDLDLHNPNRHYFFIIQDHKSENIIKLKQALGVQATYSPDELEALALEPGFNPQYSEKKNIQRAFGNGAYVYFVLCIDYMTRLHRNWDSLSQIEAFNFDAYYIRGTASGQMFNSVATNYPQILNKPRIIATPTIATEVQIAPKKLKVCFTETMFRFMAMKNIKFFFASQAPELFSRVEFVDLSESLVHQVRQHLNESAIFIALDMGIEYPNLVPEAMLAGNVVLGFSGAYDNLAVVDNFADFSPEGSYLDIAQKLVNYIQQYEEKLAQEPDYLHPLAHQARLYAQDNFTVERLKSNMLSLMRALHLNVN
ncbi:hypothetical protein CJP74_07085 [Psittacicella melopsittaci]|uniref:Uncharacterized protein n=1 Tax=Psittacicella melopsittaci TaxID=2028576 RepID=A0A3A1Y2S8_9GAMM|nr:hypothetical protein [Psittacicella melopsittaci]RIY31518.1 hypothetical protein CJP74_07085 [Psittacicella melopsittaci]